MCPISTKNAYNLGRGGGGVGQKVQNPTPGGPKPPKPPKTSPRGPKYTVPNGQIDRSKWRLSQKSLGGKCPFFVRFLTKNQPKMAIFRLFSLLPQKGLSICHLGSGPTCSAGKQGIFPCKMEKWGKATSSNKLVQGYKHNLVEKTLALRGYSAWKLKLYGSARLWSPRQPNSCLCYYKRFRQSGPCGAVIIYLSFTCVGLLPCGAIS